MTKSMLKGVLLAGSAVVALTAASSAFAAGFANRQQSATGMGFSYAGAGTSAFGLGSMFWNPANITNFAGRNSEWNVSLIVPNTSVTTESLRFIPAGNANLLAPPFNGAPFGFSSAGSGNINQGVVTPASYNSYQVNNWLWLGLQTGAPFGSTTKADAGFAGAVYGTSTRVRATAFTPTIGIKVSDWLSFGFGVTAQQLMVDLKSGDARFAGFGAGAALLASNIRIKGDAWGYGWTAGMTVKPFAGTEVSLGYRSSIRHELEGEFDISRPAGANPAIASRLIKANVNLPDIATLGIKHEINSQWMLTGTVQWTNWSRIQTAPVVSRTTGAPLTGLGFRYRDEWFLAAGVQYALNQNWKLRAGVAYEISPVTDETRGVRVLDNDRLWLSAGVGYKFNNKLELDFSYSHIFIKNGRVDIVGVNNPANPAGNPSFNNAVNYSGSSKGHVDIVAVSLKYRWDDPAPSAQPVLKKY
jgi:long-chain fatty acid transport protein